jgi:pseudaminic acid cytidylyltransferase
MTKNLCIIPARGGSKRIPRKNIKDFLGKPIIAYSIDAALKSGLFDDVMVSTDDEEIAKVARKYGASVPFMRCAKTADDFATLSDVVNEVLGNYNFLFDYVCCILPTAPLIRPENLQSAYEILINEDYNSVRPIVKFSYPIQRALKLDKNNEVSFFYPEYAKTRSQDLEPAYHDAGQFYWMKGDKGLIAEKRGAIIIAESEVQDIDSLEDWKLAEIKYKILED